MLSDSKMELDDVQDRIEDMKTSKIIEQHIESYSNIWQGKNGRFYTHLPDKSKKEGRQLIAKSQREDVEKVIVSYYRSLEEENRNGKITLQFFYPR